MLQIRIAALVYEIRIKNQEYKCSWNFVEVFPKKTPTITLSALYGVRIKTKSINSISGFLLLIWLFLNGLSFWEDYLLQNFLFPHHLLFRLTSPACLHRPGACFPSSS